MVDFLRLIDVNAGGLRLRKGQGILHLRNSHSTCAILTALSKAAPQGKRRLDSESAPSGQEKRRLDGTAHSKVPF